MKKETLTGNFGKVIEGPYLINSKIFRDERGYFFESWNKKSFEELINKKVDFVQDNQSNSNYGVFRGLHFQLNPKPQGKLVRVVKGKVFDIILDLRKGSNTYKSWVGIYLEDKIHQQLWIPEGFAHGFLSLEDNTILNYKTTDYWYKELERSLNFKDDSLNIILPELKNCNFEKNISLKDLNGLSLNELEKLEETF